MPSVPIRTPALSTSNRSGAVLDQHGVGVVDVRVDPVPARQPRQPGQAAVRSRHRQVVHLPRRALADPQLDQLVVGPERPVEQHQVGRGQPASSASSSPPQPGTKAQVPAGPLVPEDEPDRVARPLLAGETRRPGRHREARRPRARSRCRRGSTAGGRSGTSSVTPTSAKARVTARIRESSSITRRTASVASTWSCRASRSSTTPSVWSSSASVKTIPSTGTWRYPLGARRGASRSELGVDVGRRVEQEPARAVRADGGGRLAARDGALGIGAGHPTGGAPAVPLREPPTGGGTEKNDVHGSEAGKD